MLTARTDSDLLYHGGSADRKKEEGHSDKAGLCSKMNKYTSRKLLEYDDDNS